MEKRKFWASIGQNALQADNGYIKDFIRNRAFPLVSGRKGYVAGEPKEKKPIGRRICTVFTYFRPSANKPKVAFA